MARAIIHTVWFSTSRTLPSILADARAIHAVTVEATVDRADLIFTNLRKSYLRGIKRIFTPACCTETRAKHACAMASTLWSIAHVVPISTVFLLAVLTMPYVMANAHCLGIVPVAVRSVAIRCRGYELLLLIFASSFPIVRN